MLNKLKKKITDGADELFAESSLSGYHAATRLYERDLLDPTAYNVS